MWPKLSPFVNWSSKRSRKLIGRWDVKRILKYGFLCNDSLKEYRIFHNGYFDVNFGMEYRIEDNKNLSVKSIVKERFQLLIEVNKKYSGVDRSILVFAVLKNEWRLKVLFCEILVLKNPFLSWSLTSLLNKMYRPKCIYRVLWTEGFLFILKLSKNFLQIQLY